MLEPAPKPEPEPEPEAAALDSDAVMWENWGRVLEDWDAAVIRHSGRGYDLLKRLVEGGGGGGGGVPEPLRGKVWHGICGAAE